MLVGALMDSDTKKLIRSVVRRVHPDLFTGHAFERQCNSDSLKVRASVLHHTRRDSAVAADVFLQQHMHSASMAAHRAQQRSRAL